MRAEAAARPQKPPLDSGTWKVPIGRGWASSVMSSMSVTWRVSWQALATDSETTNRKSRVAWSRLPA